jgi:hypothetical protein
MAGNPLVDVVMAAALMKATQPQHFKSFCDAVRAIEVQSIAELASADAPNDMFRAQGKMKFVQQLRKHLTECAELRDTYTRRDHNARQPTA